LIFGYFARHFAKRVSVALSIFAAASAKSRPQASILIAETNILLLWRFEWKSV
jgi:hypothetical protein